MRRFSPRNRGTLRQWQASDDASALSKLQGRLEDHNLDQPHGEERVGLGAGEMKINLTKEEEHWQRIDRLQRRVRRNPNDWQAKRRLRELMK